MCITVEINIIPVATEIELEGRRLATSRVFRTGPDMSDVSQRTCSMAEINNS